MAFNGFHTLRIRFEYSFACKGLGRFPFLPQKKHMKPLFVLLITFGLIAIITKVRTKQFDIKIAGRVAMTGMLCFTALGHFMFAEGMAQMLPDFVPQRKLMVWISGILEILLGIGLLIPQLSKKVGVGLILFLIAVLPANVYAALKEVNYQTGELDGPGLNYLWFRVPLQLFFIGWVYFSSVKAYQKR